MRSPTRDQDPPHAMLYATGWILPNLVILFSPYWISPMWQQQQLHLGVGMPCPLPRRSSTFSFCLVKMPLCSLLLHFPPFLWPDPAGYRVPACHSKNGARVVQLLCCSCSVLSRAPRRAPHWCCWVLKDKVCFVFKAPRSLDISLSIVVLPQGHRTSVCQGLSSLAKGLLSPFSVHGNRFVLLFILKATLDVTIQVT